MIGINALTDIILQATKSATPTNVNVLGTIQGDMSLRIDGFAHAIPKSDYLISEGHYDRYDKGGEPYRMKNILKAGGRVICMPMADGHTYVVMSHVKGGAK